MITSSDFQEEEEILSETVSDSSDEYKPTTNKKVASDSEVSSNNYSSDEADGYEADDDENGDDFSSKIISLKRDGDKMIFKVSTEKGIKEIPLKNVRKDHPAALIEYFEKNLVIRKE